MLSKDNFLIQGKSDTFYIKERFPSYLSPRFKKVYLMQIVKAFSLQCHDRFFPEGVPVSLQIELTMKKNGNKIEKEEELIVGFPRLDEVGRIFLEALSGAAYYAANQVSEVFITKRRGDNNIIKIQVLRG